MSFAARFLAFLAGARNPLGAGSATGDGLATGGPASGQVQFKNDGTIAYITTSSGPASGPTNWYDPTTTSIGSSYWVKYTPTTGTLTTNGAATPTSMAGNPAAIKSVGSGVGSASCTFTVDIYSDSGGTQLVVSSPGWVVGYQHTV